MIAVDVVRNSAELVAVVGGMGALGVLSRWTYKAIRWGQRVEAAVVKTEQQTNGDLAARFDELKELIGNVASRLEAVERRQKEQP